MHLLLVQHGGHVVIDSSKCSIWIPLLVAGLERVDIEWVVELVKYKVFALLINTLVL